MFFDTIVDQNGGQSCQNTFFILYIQDDKKRCALNLGDFKLELYQPRTQISSQDHDVWRTLCRKIGA